MSELTLSTDLVLNSLLGKNTTTDVVKDIQKRLKKICTPWEKDGCYPAGWVRKNGMGNVLGVVNARLGGFASPHKPHKHGWGFEGKNPAGSGVHEQGIALVDTGQLVLDATENKADIEACEEKAKMEAMKEVDDFLVREFDLVLLRRVL